jgi:hypothetical protein
VPRHCILHSLAASNTEFVYCVQWCVYLPVVLKRRLPRRDIFASSRWSRSPPKKSHRQHLSWNSGSTPIVNNAAAHGSSATSNGTSLAVRSAAGWRQPSDPCPCYRPSENGGFQHVPHVFPRLIPSRKGSVHTVAGERIHKEGPGRHSDAFAREKNYMWLPLS